MAINIRIVRLQAPATNITQDYTITDFGTVQAVIIVAGTGGSDGTDVNDINLSFGFWDTSNVAHWVAYYEHGVAIATAESSSHQGSTNIVAVEDNITGIIRNATISAVSNGIRLTWAGSDLTKRPYVIVTLINGLNGAQAGAATPNANDAGTDQETTSGITPKVIFAGQNRGNIGDGTFGWATSSFGFAYDTGSGIDQRAVAWNLLGGSASANQSASDDRIAINMGASQIDTEQEITAMASGSFTQTTRNVSGSGADSSDLYYLALDFDEDAAVFSSQVTTATGDWTPLTGGSFTPSAVFMLPTFSATINDVETGNEAGFYGIYVADGTNEYQLGWNFQDAASPNSNTSSRTDQKLWNSDDEAGAADFDAGSPTFGSGSITYADANVNHSVTAKASYVFGIAFAAAAAAGNPYYYYANQ